MALRFYSEHKSWSEDLTWKVEIWDSAHVGASTEFFVSGNGVEIEYRADGDSILSPILGSTASFVMMVQDATHEDLINDMAAATEGRFVVLIYRNTVFNWVGVINSQDIEIADQYYPYEFSISAVDGLALLKNYPYGQTINKTWGDVYEGQSRIVDIIARSIKKLPHVQDFLVDSSKFLVTAINFYSDLSPDPATATDDPFWHHYIDNRAFAKGKASGAAKIMSCYDVIANILREFGARIMLTDGYFLIEQIEHRSTDIGTNANYSRYYDYDITEPLANTLDDVQQIGNGEAINKKTGGTYSFTSAAQAVRATQALDNLQNVIPAGYWDQDTPLTIAVGWLKGPGVVMLSGSVEWEVDNVALGSYDAIVGVFEVTLELGGKWARRNIVFGAGGTYTSSAVTWQGTLDTLEMAVTMGYGSVGDPQSGQGAFNMRFKTDSAFTDGDLVISFDFVGLYGFSGSSQELIDPADYGLDWAIKDPYCSIQPSRSRFAYKSTTYQVNGNADNTDVFETTSIIGDKDGDNINQWGGLLFFSDPSYDYTSQWGNMNGTRNRPITQLLAQRLISFMYYPRKILRTTAIGSTFVIQTPVQENTGTYILKNGRYNTERDEMSGEWVALSFTTAELTYGDAEYDTGDYQANSPGGGASSGGGPVDNGGAGSGGGGGNGIYGGSGTIASGTVASMSGDFSFANTSASAGEAFQITIDDGSSSNVIKAEAGQGITIQSTGDIIAIEGETAFSDVITSASLGSDQNDYSGLDGANVGRLTASTAVNITGIASGSIGRLLAIHNVGSNPVTLVNASSSSTAANRFDIGEDYTIRAKHGVVLQYDSTDSRWRIIAADRLGRLTEAYTTSTATTVSLTATTPATNVGVAVVPKGTGALTAQVAEGTSAGGNARGQYAVDWQMLRTNATDVASGNYSTIPGGRRCTASGQYSFATGFRATASGDGSVCFGGSGSFSVGASATGSNSFAFGTGADATATNAVAFLADASAESAMGFGRAADKYSMFATIPVAFLKWGNQLTLGTSTYELTLDGSSLKASVPSGERWQFEVCVFANTAVIGDGTGTANHQYFASYVGVIRNIGGTTSLLGTVDALMAAKADATIADAAFAITADDTNDYLKIVFTPPSTAGSSSQYSVGASAKLFIF